MRWLSIVLILVLGAFACVGSEPALGDRAANDDDAGRADGAASTSGDGAVLDDAGAVGDGSLVDARSSAPEPPLGGARLWLDARKVSPGVASATWLDSSGNGANAVGAVAVMAEPSAIHGRPAMRFLSEDNQGMRVPADAFSLSLTEGFAVFVVAKAFPKSPAPIYPTFVERTTSPSRNGIWMFWQVPETPIVQGALLSHADPTPNDVGATVVEVSVFEPHVYAMWFGGGLFGFSIDGAASPPKALSGDNSNFASNGTAPFTVAGSNAMTGADYGFSGYIGSVSVYTRTLDSASVAQAVANLKTDWGIP